MSNNVHWTRDIGRTVHRTAATLLLVIICFEKAKGGALQLKADNLDGVLAGNDLVMINFYADWCRFSNLLSPIWDESADKIMTEMPDIKVSIGKIDCDAESDLCQKYMVNKYPTIRYVQYGKLGKKEYRGQRSTDSIMTFVRNQMSNPLQEWTNRNDLQDKLDDKKQHIIAFFKTKESSAFQTFEKVARQLKEYCDFFIGLENSMTDNESEKYEEGIHFRPSTMRTNDKDELYTGNKESEDELLAWSTEKCIPLVREITFENAEELTEEGLPFLILFHHPDDHDSIKDYNDVVKQELMPEKNNFNFLTADGLKFAHPLHHLGKSKDDLPLIAIDSFRHMYVFPKYSEAKTPGKLMTFLQDLHSGKLHREFHYGPDSSSEEDHDVPVPISMGDSQEEGTQNGDADAAYEGSEEEMPDGAEEKVDDDTPHFPRENDEEAAGKEDSNESVTDSLRPAGGVPESQFKRLGPSKSRYTLLRDEF